ncbi:MAG: UDP-2,3-diacylglucosamine diphosphatase LpxI [Inquilinus sp.]|nr:UDP-2,3-diacylglucosamine diphosphatase LpxI [Inquilinus sp.]
MSAGKDKLGILAGGGPLPGRLARRCLETGRPVFIVAFTGQTEPSSVEGVPHLWTRMGSVGPTLERLHAEGVTELCMIGPVHRPTIRELLPDLRGARMAARIGLGARGDDGLLRGLGEALADEGFRLVGAHDLMEELLAKPGLLTRRAPTDADRADIDRGLLVARAVGAVDVGQGAVVQQGVVLAVEAAEGTDAMLERAGALLRAAGGGVLVKARKPQQDTRLDMPTIGVVTVERAAAAGLAGIAVEADGALIEDAAAVAEAADRLDLFVVCLEPGR